MSKAGPRVLQSRSWLTSWRLFAYRNQFLFYAFVPITLPIYLAELLSFSLLFSLQKATGAVLVSQEPTKVILYRGWGASQEPPTSSRDSFLGQEGGTRPVVSPELISAIRLECGLQRNQDSKTVA